MRDVEPCRRIVGGGRAPRIGFTLAEVLLALAILAVLTSVAVPGIQKLYRRSRENACRANLRTLAGAVQWYAADLDREVEVHAEGDLEELLQKGYLASRLSCPDHGAYDCSARQKRCTCSKHGTLSTSSPADAGGPVP